MQPYKNCNLENAPSVTSHERKQSVEWCACTYLVRWQFFVVLLLVIFMSRYTFIAFVFGAVLVHLQRYEMVCHHSSFSMTIKWWVRIYIFFSLFCSFVFIIAISSISSYFGEKKNQFARIVDCCEHPRKVKRVSSSWSFGCFACKCLSRYKFYGQRMNGTSHISTRHSSQRNWIWIFCTAAVFGIKNEVCARWSSEWGKNWTASINLSNVSDVWPLVKCLFGVFVALGLWCDVRWSRKIELNHHYHQTSSKLKPNKYNTT